MIVLLSSNFSAGIDGSLVGCIVHCDSSLLWIMSCYDVTRNLCEMTDIWNTLLSLNQSLIPDKFRHVWKQFYFILCSKAASERKILKLTWCCFLILVFLKKTVMTHYVLKGLSLEVVCSLVIWPIVKGCWSNLAFWLKMCWNIRGYKGRLWQEVKR